MRTPPDDGRAVGQARAEAARRAGLPDRTPRGTRGNTLPTARNGYVDLVRLVAIVVVVVGHWLDTIVVMRAGLPVGQSALAVVGYVRWLTLLLQVMPLFFLAGGFAGAASWPSWRARGGHWSGWAHARITRLLRPTAWFVGICSGLVIAAGQLGVDPSVLAQAGWAVALQLWFLPVYMLLLLLAVPLRAAWMRYGWLTLACAVAMVGVVDVLVRSGHQVAAWVSYLVAPAGAYLLGIAWHAGALARRVVPLALAVGGALALLVLVTAGGYPPWMIGVPGEPTSNTSPPNLALVAYAAAQIGLVLLLEPALRGWVARPRTWAVVVRGNAVIMTLYLWHMVPVVIMATLVMILGLPTGPGAGTAAWWVLRIPWIAGLGLLLAAVVALMGRFERPRPARPGMSGAGASALVIGSAGLTGWALSQLALGGFAPSGTVAVGALVAFAAGMLVLGLAGRVGRARATDQSARERTRGDLPLR